MDDFIKIKSEPLNIKKELKLADNEIRDIKPSNAEFDRIQPHSDSVSIASVFLTQIKEEPLQDEPEYIRYNDIPNNSKHQCDICCQLTLNTQNLTTHRYTHTTDDRYTCLKCYKTYDSKRQLYGHIRGCHLISHKSRQTRGKLHKCDICHKRFATSRNVSVHMRAHIGETPYDCHICHKGFYVKYSLTIHIRTHTGEKPFECDICHKRFNQNSILTAHMRTHTGEKPFQCDICHKLFNQNSVLKIHMRTHTMEKPFECRICHKRISTHSNLKKHFEIKSLWYLQTGNKWYCRRLATLVFVMICY